ncbi:MAG: hypothetical protein AABY87_06050 [bacterium]
MIGVVPYLGTIIKALIGFYAGLAFAALYGQVCRGAWDEQVIIP